MRKGRVSWIALALVALVVAVTSFVYYAATHRTPALAAPASADALTGKAGRKTFRTAASRALKSPASLWQKTQNYWREQFPPRINLQLGLSGSTGTPVVVGCRIDGSRSVVFRGVTPTNFTVHARRRLDYAVKNLGTNMPRLEFSYNGNGVGGSAGIGPRIVPPFYGFRGEVHWGPTQGGGGNTGILHPTDWPVTLPPGMTERDAKTHDFARELTQIQLSDQMSRLAENPQDLWLLTGVGRLNFRLKNHGAGEEAYQRFFAIDCNDAIFLNIVVYEYVNYSGTNIERAYELARKAQALTPKGDYQEPFIMDTVGWIELKRGYYREALSLLTRSAQRLHGHVEVLFHLGMTHYMLMDERSAQEVFQRVVQHPNDFPEKETAKRCLAVLDVKVTEPNPEIISKLKARLTEVPDDPIALSRLGEIYEKANTPIDALSLDPLATKAVGMLAYRQREHARAIECLAESVKSRTTDGEAFLYLGLARNQLGQTNECIDSLRRAKGLGLKTAQIEEADVVLSSLSQR